MYRYDGINTHGLTSVTWSLPAQFAIGIALRTTSPAQGVAFGFSDAAENWFYVAINEDMAGAFKANYVHVAIACDNTFVDIEFPAAALFDGQVHRLVIQRSAGDVIDCWLDDDHVVEEFDGSALGELDGVSPREMCFGALNNDGGIEQRATVDLGEFWCRSGGIVTPQLVRWIAGGVSPRSFNDGLTHYWPAYGSNSFLTGGQTVTNSGVACDHPIMAITNLTRTAVAYGDPDGPRYEIFIADGAPADPDAVSPTCVVPRAVTAPNLYGTLPSSTTVFKSVYAANATGRSEEGTMCSFPTDANGEPSLVPAVPYDAQAIPLVGGVVKLRWRYTETSPVPGAIANHFDVVIEQLLNPGEAALPLGGAVVVPYSPGEYFETLISLLTSGRRYVLTVSAVSALGATAGPSVGAMVLVDGSPPVVPALTLGAA